MWSSKMIHKFTDIDFNTAIKKEYSIYLIFYYFEQYQNSYISETASSILLGFSTKYSFEYESDTFLISFSSDSYTKIKLT